MSTDNKIFLKIAWALASVSCFFLPMLVIPFDDWHSWVRRVGPDMIFGMFVLSFPAGLPYFLVVALVADIFFLYESPVSLYVLLWFGFFVIGYLQWFHFLPQLLDKSQRSSRQGLTTLGLDKGQVTMTKQKRHRSRRGNRKKAAPPQVEAAKVLQFEEVLGTPLERVIGDR